MSVMLGSVDLNFIYLSPLQDYGKESQAKDVIEEYFKSKKWSVNKMMKWSSGVCYWFELLGWILSIILLCTNLVAWLVHHFMSSFSKLRISDLFIFFNFEKAWQVCIRFLRLQSSTPKSQTITSLLHNAFIKYDLKYFNPLILELIIMGYNSRKSYIKPDN